MLSEPQPRSGSGESKHLVLAWPSETAWSFDSDAHLYGASSLRMTFPK